MEIPLSELMQGALQEQFSVNLQQVLDNVYDPNTSAQDARKLTIEMTLKPDSDREIVKLSTVTKLKLAPSSPLETKLVLAYDARNQCVVADEWNGQMKGQMELDEIHEPLPGNVTKINAAK